VSSLAASITRYKVLDRRRRRRRRRRLPGFLAPISNVPVVTLRRIRESDHRALMEERYLSAHPRARELLISLFSSSLLSSPRE